MGNLGHPRGNLGHCLKLHRYVTYCNHLYFLSKILPFAFMLSTFLIF